MLTAMIPANQNDGRTLLNLSMIVCEEIQVECIRAIEMLTRVRQLLI